MLLWIGNHVRYSDIVRYSDVIEGMIELSRALWEAGMKLLTPASLGDTPGLLVWELLAAPILTLFFLLSHAGPSAVP